MEESIHQTNESPLLSALEYEVSGVIRRIPIEQRGTSKRGTPWTRGGVYLEVPTEQGSAPLYVTAWGDELVEQINRIGMGKTVKVRFRIETRESYPGSYRTDVSLVSIQGMTKGENMMYRIKNTEDLA